MEMNTHSSQYLWGVTELQIRNYTCPTDYGIMCHVTVKVDKFDLLIYRVNNRH